MSQAHPLSTRRATAMAAAALCAALCHAPATARETRVLLALPGGTYDRLNAPVVNDRGQVALTAYGKATINVLQWREGSGMAVLAGLGPQLSFVFEDVTQNNLGDVGFTATGRATGKRGVYLSTALDAGPLGEVGARAVFSDSLISSIGKPTLARNRQSMVFDATVEPGVSGQDEFALVGSVVQGKVYRNESYIISRQPLNAPPDRDSQDMPYRLINAHHVLMGDQKFSSTFSGQWGRRLDSGYYDLRFGAVFFTDANFAKLYTVGYDYQRPVAGNPQTFQNMRDVTPVLAVGRGQMDGTGVAFAADLSSRDDGVVDGRGVYRFLSKGYLSSDPLPYGTPTGTLTEVARTGTAAPGGGKHLSFDQKVFVNDSMQVAYSGEVSARPRTSPALPQGRQHGAIFIDRTVVVDEGQAAPTASGGMSGTFGKLTLNGFNNAGVALFSSTLVGAGPFAQGVFLGDGRERVSVVRTGDTLEGRSGSGRQVELVSPLSNDAVNVHGQVGYGVQFANGAIGTYLFTPTLHWRDPGSVRGFTLPMAWDDAKHWTLGLAPADVHDVVIDPSFKVSIKGPGTDLTVRSLGVGTGSGAVQLALQQGVQLTVREGGLHVGARGTLTGSGTVVGSLVNDGLVRPTNIAVTNLITNHARIEGGGTLQGSLANGSTGTVSVGAGEHLTLIGSVAGPSTSRAHQNLGAVTVAGGALTVVGGLGNQGTLHATDASLGFVGRGLLNHGNVLLDGTRVDVAGAVFNATDGRIKTGAGTLAVFHDHVHNAGEIDLGTTDPAQVIGGLDLTGTSRLSFVLGAAGGGAALEGDGRVDLAGRLAVAFGAGVAPHAGDDFHVFDWSGANVHGSFTSYALPDLGAIGAWDTSDLLIGGWLSITGGPVAASASAMWRGDGVSTGSVAMEVAAVPEPGTWMLMLGGMLAIGMVQRRRAGRSAVVDR